MNNLTVTPETAGQRLDKFLTEQLGDRTRSQIQKLIKSGGVTVNGQPTSVHRFLKAGDSISVGDMARQHVSTTVQQPADEPARHHATAPTIIADTPDYLVLDKPAGLLVHVGANETEPTLVDWLLTKYPSIRKIGEDPVRPGIVHRLDKDVSGLMVVAKTQAMFDHLKEQFKKRSIIKRYVALVYGSPATDTGEITFNIDRSNTEKRMAAVPEHEQRGRKAVTAFDVVHRFPQYTLLRLTLHTGRTHQLRVHLFGFGLPIVGDRIYKPKKGKLADINQIFLQSYALGFTDVAGKQQAFTISLTPELRHFLNPLLLQKSSLRLDID